MKRLYHVLLVFLLSSCIGDDVDFRNRGTHSDIGIYLVKEGQLEPPVTTVDLELLELENEAWLSETEIKFYDWSSHIFYLTEEKEKEKHSGRYFVLKAGGEPLFLGLFFPIYSSAMPQFPSIIAHDDFFYPTDVIALGGYGFYETTTSFDKDHKFRTAMEKSGLLREGISVELTGLDRVNASSLKYTFTVTNHDSENIYVMDPERMGSSRFHYYTNGVYLTQNKSYWWAENINATPSEKIAPNWYYKLSPGRSITRTVQLDAYNSLPSGAVSATFNFPGARVNKGEWQKNDGRIWLGSFRVEAELDLQ